MRVGHHHPGAVGQQLSGRGHLVEQQRRQRLRALHEQSVGESLERVGEPVGVILRAFVRPGAQGRRRGSARGPAARRPRRPCRWTAASTGRTRGATRSHRPRTPTARVAGRCRGRRRSTPPRTANSPRCSTTSARVYPRSTSRSARSSGASSLPDDQLQSAAPCPAWGSMPCIAASAGATTTRTVPAPRGAGGRRRHGGRTPRARERSARTAGTSHAGSRATRSCPRNAATSAASASASRGPAVTAMHRGLERAWRSPAITRGPDRPRPEPGSAGRARAAAARTARTRSGSPSDLLQAHPTLPATPRTGLVAARRAWCSEGTV